MVGFQLRCRATLLCSAVAFSLCLQPATASQEEWAVQITAGSANSPWYSPADSGSSATIRVSPSASVVDDPSVRDPFDGGVIVPTPANTAFVAWGRPEWTRNDPTDSPGYPWAFLSDVRKPIGPLEPPKVWNDLIVWTKPDFIAQEIQIVFTAPVNTAFRPPETIEGVPFKAFVTVVEAPASYSGPVKFEISLKATGTQGSRALLGIIILPTQGIRTNNPHDGQGNLDAGYRLDVAFAQPEFGPVPIVNIGSSIHNPPWPLPISWMWNGNESELGHFEVNLATDPQNPEETLLGEWKNAGTARFYNYDISGLAVYSKVYPVVRAAAKSDIRKTEIGIGSWVDIQLASVAEPGEAKQYPDDSLPAISRGLVTMVFGSKFYIAGENNPSGLAVGIAPGSIKIGDRLSLRGRLDTTVNGERILMDPESITSRPGPAPEPVSLSLRDLCGKSVGFNPVTGAGMRGVTYPVPYGPSTIGMLVKVSGWVVGNRNGNMAINDFSLAPWDYVEIVMIDDPGSYPIADNQYVTVTGISTIQRRGTNWVQQIRTRKTGYITIESQPIGVPLRLRQ